MSNIFSLTFPSFKKSMYALFWYNLDTTYMREFSCVIALIKALKIA